MNNELKYIFGNINEWLKFAEVKHAGLLVLNSALVIGVTSQYSNLEIFDKYPTTFSLSILGLSIAGSLLAQFPITSNLLIRQKKLESPNIYFFSDLSKISESNFIDAFKAPFPILLLTVPTKI